VTLKGLVIVAFLQTRAVAILEFLESQNVRNNFLVRELRVFVAGFNDVFRVVPY